MSACSTFTEHVWKPGECKNCFKPKSLHCITAGSAGRSSEQTPAASKQLHQPSTGAKTNSQRASAGSLSRSGHFRPPVAKKPTIAVKPTMMLPCSSARPDSDGTVSVIEPGKTSAFTVWNHNGLNCKNPCLSNNNNEGEDRVGEIEGYGPLSPRTPSGNNNSGLTDVLKEIAGLGPGPSPGPLGASKDIFWDRISSSYRRSLERGLPASSCLALGSGSSNGGCAATKHVSLSDGRKIISTEGGRYCYPEYSSEGEDEEEEEEEEDSERDLEEDEDDEHESWEESDEELLAMEIRMRGQPRFANFRAATLSPVRFAAGKKWNTVPLRNRSLQRICAVDYDDSYDEILNDHPSMASSGALLPYRSHDMHGSGFLTNAESTTSAEPSSSQPDESYTPTSSDGSFSSAFMSAVQSPSPFKSPEPCTSPKKESVQRALSPIKVTETHKAVLAIRLEDQDGREGTKMPQALPGQPVTISFSPTEEQAKPYRVVNLEKSLICKPYTVVDVSASMASKEEHVSDAKHRNAAMPVTPTQVCNPLRAQPLSPASPVQIISTALSTSASVHTTTTSQKKLGSIRYQEVWTSSTSPRQKMPKVDVGVSTRGNNHTPSNSQRFCHKSAPTSPVAGPSSSRTVPIKSPNLSEIKFNSFNNAGMPPFPIIIRDEPAYVRSSKNAVKVPIVINPSAYDNLAVYKSFLGLSGELPQGKSMSSRATSHTYEEIGSSESVQSSSAEKTISRNGHSEEASGEESKVKSPVLHSPTPHDSTETVTPAPIPSSMHSNPASSADVRKSPVSVSLKNGCKESNTCNELVKDSHESTGSHRGEASSVLSQIVSSIHPPKSPPEALPALSKTFSSEELYSIPPDAVKETLTRPKSFFSSTDVCLSTRNTPTKVLFKSQSASASVPLSTAQSEPSVPFPPPRSTSSPYHASNILQRHFGNWTKSSACSSPSRPVDGEASPSKEGRRVSAEGSKPKRWISFKSFFRRRKEEDEQKVQKEKGKLVGLDGTVIHVLPPPPAQKQSWFTEARAEDPSQKPTIIFTYKPESGSGDDALQVNDGSDASHSTPAADRESRLEGPGTTTELQSIEENSVAKELSRVQGGSGAARERDLPGFITPLPAHINLDLVFGVRENNHVGPGTVHGADEREDDASGLSHSPASSQCSATYSNLGQSRANMIPLKHPRNIKASNDTLASIDLDGPTDPPSLKGTPPPLPKKIVHRSSTEPGKEPVRGSLKSWAEVKPGGTNLSVANPLYDLDSTWDTASQSSSLSSEPQRAPGVESGDSLERPAAKSTNKTRPANSMSSLVHPPPPPKERTFPSMESLAGRNRRTQQGPGASKPQRAALYRGLESWDEVVGKIRGLHTDTLRKLAAKCEDRFMAGQKDHLRFGTDSWSHFRLTTGRPCCEAGDAVYFTASYAKDPLVNYAIKICRSTMKETQQQFFHSLAVRQSLAVHFNIQQDCGHFLADVPARMLPWEEEEEDEEDEEEDKEEVEKEDGNRERPEGPDPQSGEDPGLSSAAHLRSRVVVITREVPFQTVADFVREGVSRHGQQPELYERQVCLLLLQLCAGLEHMKPHHVTHCDLRLENLLLVQCQPGRLDSPELNNNNSSAGASSAASATSAAGATCPARLIISNFSQAKQKSALLAADPGTLRDQSRLAPEIVTATQYRKCDEFQTGILIYEMLHRPNPFEVTPELKEREYTWADLPALPVRSLYSQGLQQLARLLLTVNPSERIRMSEARACLQCLLWGPREDLFQALGCSGPDQRDVTLQNWLDLKRTLMMIKFAERSLDSGSGVSLEDWLCCQYLAFASTDSLSRVVHILQLPSKPSHATQNQAHAAHNCHSTQPL